MLTGTNKEVLAAARLLQHMIDHCHSAIIDAGAIPHLVQLLKRSNNAHLREDAQIATMAPIIAIRALLNLATLKSHNRICHRSAIVREGAINPIVVLLRTQDHHDTRVQATWMLVCLSMRKRFRVDITNAGALTPLVTLLEFCITYGNGDSKATNGILAATRALHNISICSEHRDTIVSAGALTPLIQLIGWWQKSGTPDANTAALVAVRVLQNLASCAAKAHAIISAGALTHLVTMLNWGLSVGGIHDAKMAAQAALEVTRALQNIAFWAENRTAVVHADALTPLIALMSS